jgi:hypothetical protein
MTPYQSLDYFQNLLCLFKVRSEMFVSFVLIFAEKFGPTFQLF